jgi:DnaJ-domain-containing protein 1
MTSIIINRNEHNDFQITIRSGSREDFRRCIETLKTIVETGNRIYRPEVKQWVVAAVSETQLLRWLDVCRADCQAEVQWVANDAGKGTTPQIDPYSVLHLLPTAPPDLIKAAYRTLAQLHHPDHGGDTRTMQLINEAYKRLAA